ncbi:MAG: hypothetical protein ACRDK8_10170 [Solirubrobacteraceae bacterium]
MPARFDRRKVTGVVSSPAACACAAALVPPAAPPPVVLELEMAAVAVNVPLALFAVNGGETATPLLSVVAVA